MKEQLINLETAKLAKEKGFDIQCIHGFVEDVSDGLSKGISEEFYWELGDRPNDNYFENLLNYDQEDVFFYSRPTQTLLQKWLREEHLIHIEILLSEESPYNTFYYRIMQIGKYFTLSHDGIYKNTYEEALEKGLFEALKLI